MMKVGGCEEAQSYAIVQYTLDPQMGWVAVYANRNLMHSVLKKDDLNPGRDCVETVLEFDGVHHARVNAFWSRWSRIFLHSSDVVLALSPVIDSVIGLGDSIRIIDALKFISPMTGQLNVYAAKVEEAEGVEKLLCASSGKPAFTLTAHTRKGQKIVLVSYSTTDSVDKARYCANDPLLTVSSGFGSTHYMELGPAKVQFSIPLVEERFSYDQGTSSMFPAYLAMDVVMYIRQLLEAHGAIGNFGSVLAASFEKFQVPPLDFFEKNDAILTMVFDANKVREKKGHYILPIEFEFKTYGETAKAGGGIYNAAIPKER